MSDISGQLIKNSFNYVLQSDLVSGVIYRIGGVIPVNPKFVSGLTVNSLFNYSNGTEQNGYVLISDNLGNASWGPLSADIFVTGFTYLNNTFTIVNNSGLTLTASINDVTGFTINGDLVVTGETYLSGLTQYDKIVLGLNPFEITNVDYVTGFVQTFDVYVTGATYNSATNNSNETYWDLQYHSNPLGGPYSFSGENTFTTGGTYDNNTTLITFDKNDGSNYTVDLSSIDINDTYVTGGTNNPSTTSSPNATIDLLYNQDIPPSTYFLPYTDVFVTGFTYDNSNTFTIFDNSGNTFSQTVNDVTGLTINGNLLVTGTTTLSGLTQYDEIVLGTNPFEITNVDYVTGFVQTSDVYVTGATYVGATNNTNVENWTLQYHSTPLSGPYTISGQNTFMTGFTYQDNSFEIKDNSGNTFNVFVNDFTGLTINGNLTVTGFTNLSGLTQYDEVVSGINPIEVVNVDYLTGYIQTNDVYVTGATYTASTTNSDTEYWELLYHSTPLGGPHVITGQNTFVTGFTYLNNNFEIKDNSGNTFNVLVNDFTGLTINGNLLITGDTVVQNSLSADTITLTNTPNLNNNLNQILGRDSTTGLINYREINSIGNNYTYVSGVTYSATTTDNVIGVDSSISATTIYLPNSVTSGRLRYDIKDIGLNSYNNNITIISTGSDNIISTENSNTVILQSDGGALIFFNTGTGTWLQM